MTGPASRDATSLAIHGAHPDAGPAQEEQSGHGIMSGSHDERGGHDGIAPQRSRDRGEQHRHQTPGRSRDQAVRVPDSVSRAVSRRSVRSCADVRGMWSLHGVVPPVRRARRFVMKPFRAEANPYRSSRMSARIWSSSSRR